MDSDEEIGRTDPDSLMGFTVEATSSSEFRELTEDMLQHEQPEYVHMEAMGMLEQEEEKDVGMLEQEEDDTTRGSSVSWIGEEQKGEEEQEHQRMEEHIEEDIPKRVKVGRRVKQITRLLLLFMPLRSSAKKVKKEYLRVELLRGFKRAIREIIDKITPRKKIHGFDAKDKPAQECWNIFRSFVRKHPEMYELAQTEKGPGTEGKAKRRNGEEKMQAKTFNDKFCRSFFNTSTVRRAFLYYLNVIFSDMSLDKLRNRFLFEPISSDDTEKAKNWMHLKEYLTHEMFHELGIPGEDEDLEEQLENLQLVR